MEWNWVCLTTTDVLQDISAVLSCPLVQKFCTEHGISIKYECDSMDVTDTFNTLRPRQNGRHFAEDIFKCLFFNENVWISIEISLKFVPKGPINNIPALVQIMAWRRSGDKPLSEPMVVSLPTHICVTRPQWVKTVEIFIWINDTEFSFSEPLPRILSPK